MHEPSDRARRWRRVASEVGRTLVTLCAVFAVVHFYSTRRLARGLAPRIDRAALDLHQTTVPAADGKPRLVSFFATWCGVCEAEMHNLSALESTHQVVLIASDSGSADEVRAYAKEHALKLPIIVDDGRLKRAYAVTSYPTKFFVDPHGWIDFVSVGYTTEVGIRLRLFATR